MQRFQTGTSCRPTAETGFARPRVLLLAVTQARGGVVFGTVQSGAPLGLVGGATHRTGVDVLSRSSGAWVWVSLGVNRPWWLCCGFCPAVICTGRGSHRKDSGDPGDLEMIPPHVPFAIHSIINSLSNGVRFKQTQYFNGLPFFHRAMDGSLNFKDLLFVVILHERKAENNYLEYLSLKDSINYFQRGKRGKKWEDHDIEDSDKNQERKLRSH
ncbi:hypothetical protein HPG69_006874 [Diceros bicornis minor]|uniref:Uncharacterized protein n=1 Tax=Diceros bicornis minor TaxID=77932 RepID=A0A7J7ESG7_DICBM|nr:hypothetical protein HPG69_006874 [Diceros bicornis minor]